MQLLQVEAKAALGSQGVELRIMVQSARRKVDVDSAKSWWFQFHTDLYS